MQTLVKDKELTREKVVSSVRSIDEGGMLCIINRSVMVEGPILLPERWTQARAEFGGAGNQGTKPSPTSWQPLLTQRIS